jgi:hypothetical protein
MDCMLGACDGFGIAVDADERGGDIGSGGGEYGVVCGQARERVRCEGYEHAIVFR